MRTTGKFAILASAVALLLAQGVARGDDAKCQDAVAKGSRNVGNQEQKKNRKCIKDSLGGDETTCVATESPKAAIKRTKLQNLYAVGGKCDPVASFVNPDPNDIADGTEDAAGDIIRAVWGSTTEVDGVVAGDKCSYKIAKRAGQKFDRQLKTFRFYLKNSGPITTQGQLDSYIESSFLNPTADTVQLKLDADVAAQCTTFPPSGLEDGACGSEVTAAGFSSCIGEVVNCEACLAMNNSYLGTVNCDQSDDSSLNGSCPP